MEMMAAAKIHRSAFRWRHSVVADFCSVLRGVGDSNASAPYVAMIAGRPTAEIAEFSPWQIRFLPETNRDRGGIHPVTDDSFRICKNLSLLAQLQL